MNKKINVPIFAILKALVPVIRGISKDIQEARSAESDGGQKVTIQEIRELLLDHVFDLVEVIARAIFEDNQ